MHSCCCCCNETDIPLHAQLYYHEPIVETASSSTASATRTLSASNQPANLNIHERSRLRTSSSGHSNSHKLYGSSRRSLQQTGLVRQSLVDHQPRSASRPSCAGEVVGNRQAFPRLPVQIPTRNSFTVTPWLIHPSFVPTVPKSHIPATTFPVCVRETERKERVAGRYRIMHVAALVCEGKLLHSLCARKNVLQHDRVTCRQWHSNCAIILGLGSSLRDEQESLR